MKKDLKRLELSSKEPDGCFACIPWEIQHRRSLCYKAGIDFQNFQSRVNASVIRRLLVEHVNLNSYTHWMIFCAGSMDT